MSIYVITEKRQETLGGGMALLCKRERSMMWESVKSNEESRAVS